MKVDAEGGFLLTSGRRSSFIFNLKNLYGDPEPARLITDKLLATLADFEFDYIAGLELGAVFPVTTAILRSEGTAQPIRGFVIRKAAKAHGTKNRVECQAQIPKGSRVLMIDDVTTTGDSLLEGVKAVLELGCTVADAVTLVDRQEGAAENLSRQGIRLTPLFTKSDFLGPEFR